MLTYYVEIGLPSKEAQEYALELAEKVRAEQPELELTQSKGPGYGIIISSEDSSWDIEPVCEFIQHLLQKFRPKEHASFDWSETSEVVLNTFGGGAAFITADKIIYLNTGDWVQHMEDGKGENPGVRVEVAKQD